MANRSFPRWGGGVASATSNPENALGIDLGSNQFAEAVGALLYLWSGGVPVAWNGAITQSTGQGQTLLFGSIAQGAAGTTQLVAANATKKVKLVSYSVVLDAAGSFKFTDGTADLSGAYPVAQNGGLVEVGQPSAHLTETQAINRPLNIVTVTGKAFGRFSYFLEA